MRCHTWVCLSFFAWQDSAVVDIPKYGQCNDLECAAEFIPDETQSLINRLLYVSALFANFAFAVQEPDSLMRIAWNWRETNMHL